MQPTVIETINLGEGRRNGVMYSSVCPLLHIIFFHQRHLLIKEQTTPVILPRLLLSSESH